MTTDYFSVTKKITSALASVISFGYPICGRVLSITVLNGNTKERNSQGISVVFGVLGFSSHSP